MNTTLTPKTLQPETLKPEALRPKVHVFGHIHEGYGQLERDGTLFLNVASVDVRYKPVNAPVVWET